MITMRMRLCVCYMFMYAQSAGYGRVTRIDRGNGSCVSSGETTLSEIFFIPLFLYRLLQSQKYFLFPLIGHSHGEEGIAKNYSIFFFAVGILK